MLRIGCHLSSSKGYLAMAKTAVSIDANTFQFFTRNPRGSRAKSLDPKDIEAFLTFAKEHDISQILAHAPYTLNACSADPSVREFARLTMADDLNRLEATPGCCYNFHPGSHVGQGVEKGIELICELLNKIIRPEQSTIILLETMSGKGSEVGGRFEELRAIIDGVEQKDKIGVCMDTCHVSDAGYDIVSDLDGVLEEFDNIVGLERLHALHINDSLNPPGSHKDRHAKIGEGTIGLEAIANVIRHPKLQGLPCILETPNELPGYAGEIEILRAEYEK